jgi:drug/metabolite transporter (DMT)-like permease
VFLGVASSGLGFLLYFRLLRQIGAVRATSVTFLNPIVAMVSAALYLGESITPRMVAGCAVILAGTALTLGLVRVPGLRAGPVRDRPTSPPSSRS